MRAVILAAGVGKRLAGYNGGRPKILLEFAGKTLLRRHLEILGHCGLRDVTIATGYRADDIGAAIAETGLKPTPHTILNPDYDQGSIVTLWSTREDVACGDDVMLMDADVLYDFRLIERLLGSRHRNCFLLERDVEPGEEPVKLCIRDGRVVDFGKIVEAAHDYLGESVGIFRFSAEFCQLLLGTIWRYIVVGETSAPYEVAIRDHVVGDPPDTFGFEDITGLPWTEIDFAEDVTRAKREIMPRLTEPG